MELVRETNEQKYFKDGENTYTMIDMGLYVGNRTRQWYESIPEKWFLMESNTKDNGIEIEISALVDDSGNYSHFKIKEGNINRILNLDTGYVLNDTIEDATIVDEDFGLGKMYDGKVNKTDIRRRFSFKEYLTKGVNFEGYTGHVPSLQSIVNFLQVNEYLTKEIENQKGISR